MKHEAKHWHPVAVGLLLFGVTTPAFAEPSPAEIAVARRLFKEAAALEERGRWAEAAQTLREAIGIKDTAGLRFHLANAEMEQGHLVEALIEYDRAEELIAAGEVAPDVSDLLTQAREDLKRRVPTVHVVGLRSEAGVTLTIDGRAVARSLLTHPIPQNPGPHKLVVQSAGHQRAVFEVDLREGERRQIHVKLAPEAGKPKVRESTLSESLIAGDPLAPPPQTRESGGNTARSVVVVSEVVLTAAGLGIGAGFLLNQSSIDDRAGALNRELGGMSDAAQVTSICSSPPDKATEGKCTEFRQALVDSKQSRDIAIAGFVGAGVGAVATVITLIVWDTSSPQTARAAPHGVRGWTARIQPLGAHGVVASVDARW